MSRFPISLFLLIAASVVLPALPARAQTVLLRGAVIHRPHAEEPAQGDILIRDGKIADVGPSIQEAADEVVDLSGLHLYPGLIASNTALGLVEIPAVRASVDVMEVGRFTPEVRAWVAVNPDSELIPVARAAGITHFVPTPVGGIISGQSSVVATSGWTIEEMVVRRDAAVHLTWPSMSLRDGARSRGGASGPDLPDQDSERQRRIAAITEFLEDAAAWGKAPAETRPPAWSALQPVLTGEAFLVIHADTVAEIRSILKWSGGRPWRIAIAGGRDAWRVAPELADRGIPVIYDHVFSLPARDTDAYDAAFRGPGVLHAAGVRVAIGAGTFRPSAVHNLPLAAARATAHGLPEHAAIAALTSVPAEIFGVGDRLGDIRAGLDASLIATTGSLLDVRSTVRHVWIRGRHQPLDSRHTRLYERYRSRPRQ